MWGMLTLIRETKSGEAAQVLALYPLAFEEEELRPLVSDLLGETSGVLSLAGFEGEEIIAHVIFTDCGTKLHGEGALLAPLAVHPKVQRLGWGSAVVREGLDRLTERGASQVFVLGDPGYYERFGFLPERDVLPPYPIPEAYADAWQSLTLDGREPLAAGPLHLPSPWMDESLWGE